MTLNQLDRLFDPFFADSHTENNNSELSFHTYDKLRVVCSYHLPLQIQNTVTNDFEKLNILHVNSRSIINKLDDLCTLMTETKTKWHIISVSETWLSENIENVYNLSGYNACFCSRKSGAGGGSALYIYDKLHQKQLGIPPFTTAEAVCSEIHITTNKKIAICQIYRSPNTDKNLFIQELQNCLIYLNNMHVTALITGDFNFDLFAMESSPTVQLFFHTLLSHGFFPTISRTTRAAHPSYTLLDNIFCNDLSRVMHSGIILNDLSDHFPIFSSLNFKLDSCEEHRATMQQVFNYRKINEFNMFLSENLECLNNEQDPNIMVDRIIQVYNEGIKMFSYTKHLSRRNDPRKPWITPALTVSITQKSMLFKEKLKHPTSYNIDRYNKYKNILTKVLRSAKRTYYQGEFAKHQGNSKETWKTLQTLIKSKRKTDDVPRHIADEDGNKITNDIDIAEHFNSFFTEIGEKLCESIQPSSFDPLKLVPSIEEEMDLEMTNEIELAEIIKGLNNVGAGADNISSKIFKLSYQAIMKHILQLFNACLKYGIFPSSLKIAIIKPIFKGGDSQTINNYRPISILPFMSKILEKLIHCRLVKHLEKNDIIHENQFGFQKNKSTYMPLLLLQDNITRVFEDGEFALGLYLDIKKAFDTVNTKILLDKLHKYGVRHRSHQILSSYLTERTQSVKIRSTYSSYKNASMGVPQGSILGPLLFIIYINDLPKLSSNMTCLSYADDTAIIFKGDTIAHLQSTVNNLLVQISSWFDANFLSLNVLKTYTQHYTTRSVDFKLEVKINNIYVKENESIRYLGVLIDKSLKFTKHIDQVSNIIGRNIGIISRIRFCIDKRTAHLLYNSLILPYINYCCMIWGSNYDSQLMRLVILQKRAVRLIEYVYPPFSSEPIFKKYNILKLADIVKSQMLLVMHKFVTGQLPQSFDNTYKLCVTRSPHRRQAYHLQQPFSNRNYRLFTTSCLGPKLWNAIIAPRFPCLNDVPTSKNVIKKITRRHFVHSYNM